MVHTKLSTSNSSSNNPPTNKHENDKQYALNLQRARQTNRLASTTKPIVYNFLANIFIKEVNLVLYDDCKESFYRKNNIASVFLDDFILCYVEEVNTSEIEHAFSTIWFIN